MEKPREIAARALQRWQTERAFIEEILNEELADAALSSPDRRLAQEITYGAIRGQATLDWLIHRKAGRRDQKPLLRALLRLGLYQLFWLDRIPDHAAVHETVETAKRLGLGKQSSFLNAVLRSYVRERAATRQLLETLKTREPALGHSHPDWLYRRWQAIWGTEKAIRLLEWNNTPPKTYARLNTLRANAAQLKACWREEGVEFESRPWIWTQDDLVFELKSHPPLESLPSFGQGGFYIQDPSTLLAVDVLNPQPGETILDCCAAPGGKTTFIAQRMRNQGRIVACDSHANRVERLRDNCVRLGASAVQIEHSTLCHALATRRRDHAQHATLFDGVLVDAPCSNTGVLRRRVDLRWRIRPKEIIRLAETQLELLRRTASWLKPDGVLVYSTCSLEPEENRDVTRRFLEEHPGWRLELERELLPFVEGVDGAYVARLLPPVA